jgi:hypothetical protein
LQVIQGDPAGHDEADAFAFIAFHLDGMTVPWHSGASHFLRKIM